jgi:hypothetical protein
MEQKNNRSLGIVVIPPGVRGDKRGSDTLTLKGSNNVQLFLTGEAQN